MPKKFTITWKEWLFVGIMTLLAIIFTNKYWILLLNKLNPLEGFLVYYVIVYSALTLMSYAGMVVFGIKIKKPLQIFASGLILFAFFLIFNWENNFVAYTVTHSLTSTPDIFFGSEDGIITWFWQMIIHPGTPLKDFFWWFLSFPLTVFIITLIAVILTRKKPIINP